MTNASRVCVLLVLFCAAQAGVLTGSDFFCRDPDTGKLHDANTTWPSTSFCGNYTCKLRKKNITATNYAFRQINITNLNLFGMNHKNFEKDRKTTEVDKTQQEEKYNIMDVIKKTEDGDRYLTESEIKTISDILHLVKKSDLEAILEIYKLAQDIYKEIDTGGIDNYVSETEEYRDQDKIERLKTDAVNAFNVRAQSYWNGPAFTNFKSKDMETQGSNTVSTVTHPPKTDSYFIGPLISTDFRNLPYYYPVSNFQKVSSYTHPRPVNYPCNIKIPSEHKVTKDIQPSFYLPYPFSYIHHYNSSNPTIYSKRNYDKYDIYSRSKIPYIKSYSANVPNIDKPEIYHVVKNREKIETKPIEVKEALKDISRSNNEENETPNWQTSSLSEEVLDDVRAHIQDKSKILRPFRKNIKLERVGKLIKLDELPRKKREAERKHENKKELVMYEVFLEKTTCDSNVTTPGFFRYGNLSQPFPDCCPQRIGNR